MGFLSNLFSNPLAPIKSGFEALADIPGSPESAMNAGWDGITGEASWNPYADGASVLDEGFLGDHGAESRKNRQAGRMVGTAIGNYFTAGALSPYLGGSTIAAGAATGALQGGAQAAGTGGNIGQGVLRGGGYGGLAAGLASGTSSALSGYTDAPATYLDEFAGSTPGGTTGGYLSPAQNAAISRGVSNVGTTAARGGDVRQAGLGSLISIGSSFGQPYLDQMGDSMGLGSLFNPNEQEFGGVGGMSTGPGSGRFSDPALGYSGGAQQGPMTQVPQVAQTSPFSLSNVDTSGLGGSGTIGKQAGPSDQYSLGGSDMFGGGEGFSMPGTGGPNLQPSLDTTGGGDWQEQLKRFMGGQGGQSAMRLLSQLDPKRGGMVQALLGGGGQQKMGTLEALLGAGATVYARNRADRNLGQQAKQLQDLFTPNSPYAQQMAQKLARQDAAAGRRSQYGNREVELQARLAELNSRNAPQLQRLTDAQDMNRMRMLSELMGYGQRSGAFDYARQGLSGLMGNQ